MVKPEDKAEALLARVADDAEYGDAYVAGRAEMALARALVQQGKLLEVEPGVFELTTEEE